MERQSVDQVRDSDRKIKGEPDKMELELQPGTFVTDKGEQNNNRQRTTSSSSAYSVESARSSWYDEDVAAVPTFLSMRDTMVDVDMAACEPSLMTHLCDSPLLAPQQLSRQYQDSGDRIIKGEPVKMELERQPGTFVTDKGEQNNNGKARSTPALIEARNANSDSSDMTTKTYSPDADRVNIRRTHSVPIPGEMINKTISTADDVDKPPQTEAQSVEIQHRRFGALIGNIFGRLCDIIDVPIILVFGIILYLVDVASDVTAAVVYFQEGHPVWGSLTITFVILPAACWAAVSWTWWFCYDPDRDGDKRDKLQRYRKVRMLLAILLLDPLVRQFQVLWFTCRREYCRCRERDGGDVNEAERKRRRKDPACSGYWQRLVDVEESTATFLTAIATLMEDAPEITLQLYIIIGHGVQENIVGYIQLITSLGNIFYTTALFPRQVRLQKKESAQIRTFSIATIVLLVWRTLIVGSRIMAFVLFASMFRYWLFVVTAFHYLLMFAMVFYQMWLTEKTLPVIKKTVYNIVTPFVYIFDFCVNWLAGSTRRFYIMCYVPMYCENVLMSGLGLWYARTMTSPEWYIVLGCVCVIVMFPIAILAQVAYYRYWHPKRPNAPILELTTEGSDHTHTTHMHFDNNRLIR